MNQRGPCPNCDRGPRDKALSVTTDERGTVSFCFRCGYTNAEQSVSTFTGTGGRCSSPSVAKGSLDWSEKASSILRRTVPLIGTIGETYLRHRGCVLPPPDSDLRFLPASGPYPPSLCAVVTDVITAAPISLHFTRLAHDGHGKAGTSTDKLLLANHRKKGGCIRLWPDEAVASGLGLAEGIESALAAANAFTPVWATIDAGNMAIFPVLAGIEALTVFADHDDAGLRAATAVAQRWADAGREALIVTPPHDGDDIADVAVAA